MNLPMIGRGYNKGWVVMLLAVCLAHTGIPGEAQMQEMPPFPILFGGIATINGHPLPEGTRLIAKVGDYETWVTVQEEGTYRNLLVGPPNKHYYGVLVTFHAKGLTAVESDVFERSRSPTFNSTGFDLHFAGIPKESSPELVTKDSPTGKNAEDENSPVASGQNTTNGSADPAVSGEPSVYAKTPDPSPMEMNEQSGSPLAQKTPTLGVPVYESNGVSYPSSTPQVVPQLKLLLPSTGPLKDTEVITAEGRSFAIMWMLIGGGTILAVLGLWWGLRRSRKRL